MANERYSEWQMLRRSALNSNGKCHREYCWFTYSIADTVYLTRFHATCGSYSMQTVFSPSFFVRTYRGMHAWITFSFTYYWPRALIPFRGVKHESSYMQCFLIRFTRLLSTRIASKKNYNFSYLETRCLISSLLLNIPIFLLSLEIKLYVSIDHTLFWRQHANGNSREKKLQIVQRSTRVHQWWNGNLRFRLTSNVRARAWVWAHTTTTKKLNNKNKFE